MKNVVIGLVVGSVLDYLLKQQGAPAWVVTACCSVVLLLAAILGELWDLNRKKGQ